MKVLVTGATGFIGQNIVKELLLRENISVIATTRNLEKASKLSFFNDVSFVEIDLSKTKEDVYVKLGSPDVMIHLAWEGLPNYKQMFHLERNLFDNYFFLKKMINGGLNDLTVSGTCFEYGMVNGMMSEDMITNPSNPYGLAKDSLRKFLEFLQKDKYYSLKWLRLFYMYGSGQSEKSLISQIDKSLLQGLDVFNMSGGEQVRDYLHITEVAKMIVTCALQTKVDGVINCCSGEPVKLKTFVENYLQGKNCKMKLNFGHYPYSDFEPMSFWGKNLKINEVMKNDK